MRPANGAPSQAGKSMSQKLSRAMSRSASTGVGASTAGLWEVRCKFLSPTVWAMGDIWQGLYLQKLRSLFQIDLGTARELRQDYACMCTAATGATS